MFISCFELFKIGIGPSSSHTVGPMKAAYDFSQKITSHSHSKELEQIQIELFGSLALTGKGHGTDIALLLGLSGKNPEAILPEEIHCIPEKIKNEKKIQLPSGQILNFDVQSQIVYHRNKNLPYHPNGMLFKALFKGGTIEYSLEYYSTGGGFILNQLEIDSHKNIDFNHSPSVPFLFNSAASLLELGKINNLKIWEMILKNETTRNSIEKVQSQLDLIWNVMNQCILDGFTKDGHLPGGLKVKRRAPSLYRELTQKAERTLQDPLSILDWVNLYALSVNEENASFGKVVTAPTNGAAGIIPAVLKYYVQFIYTSSPEGIRRFLLTAAGIGVLYKLNASISGAEVGCQGEVGVASSMAAAALTEVLGGTNEQIENAAEIAMEHHLGMTCDPVGGLVQIPCIERNAMGAIKAINAARIALKGNGEHFISLDQVIETMKQTGQDMSSKYKETSRGGLAVNIPEC